MKPRRSIDACLDGAIGLQRLDREAAIEARRAEFDVDYTPPAVVRQVLQALAADLDVLEEGFGEVLDLGAGAGVWSMVARELWPDTHITAVEQRPEERQYLARWCDSVIIDDVRKVKWPDDTSFDLIMGNIPFSLPDPALPDKRQGHEGEHHKSRAEAFRAFVIAMIPLLYSDVSRLALYVPTSWWLRSIPAADLAAKVPPIEQMNIPLPIRHREKGSADLRSYSVYTWARFTRMSGLWTARDLPALSKDERKWTVVPGTERGEAPGSERT